MVSKQSGYKCGTKKNAELCQNGAAITTCTGTALTCTSTGYTMKGCTGTGLTCTDTGFPQPLFSPCVPVQLDLYRYRCSFSARKCSGFCIFTHFSPTNLLQYVPYQKSTMESLQNNSRSGLESRKTLFSQVRAFPPKSKSKYEVRVLIFLTLNLFKSPLPCCLIF